MEAVANIYVYLALAPRVCPKGVELELSKGILVVDAAIQERGRQIQVLQFLEAQRNPKVSI
jgi:hypothetical protein